MRNASSSLLRAELDFPALSPKLQLYDSNVGALVRRGVSVSAYLLLSAEKYEVDLGTRYFLVQREFMKTHEWL